VPKKISSALEGIPSFAATLSEDKGTDGEASLEFMARRK
jgi:hypothetical protein